jgi:hypothetical protein
MHPNDSRTTVAVGDAVVLGMAAVVLLAQQHSLSSPRRSDVGQFTQT